MTIEIQEIKSDFNKQLQFSVNKYKLLLDDIVYIVAYFDDGSNYLRQKDTDQYYYFIIVDNSTLLNDSAIINNSSSIEKISQELKATILKLHKLQVFR